MIEQLSKILDQRSKLDVSEINKLIPTPVFNKVHQYNGNHGNQIQTIDFGDFGSNKSLRRLVSLLKSVAELTVDTLVYSSNKEFLVNLVNERNFVIFQNLKDNIETVRLLCEMDRRFRTKMTRQTKSFLDKKRYKNDDHSLYTMREILNKRDQISRGYRKPTHSVNPDNGEITLDFSKAEPISKTELSELISISVENVIKEDVMLHSSSSDISIETLYCYYGDNQFTMEDTKPSRVTDHEIDEVVKILTAEESNDNGSVSSTITNDTNYEAFDDTTMSITDDTISALFSSPEFTRMESDFMQLPEFETIRLK